jgi:hypothetical protein
MNQKANILKQLLIGIFPFLICNALFAQSKQPFCRDLFVRDFTDKHGKKLSDPALTDDTETLFSQLATCKIILRHRRPDILVALKNDHIVRQPSTNSCIYRISDDLNQKLMEKGVFYLLSGCVEQPPTAENDKVRIFFQIEQLMDRSISYEGVLEMPRRIYQHRLERKEKLRAFIETEILRLPPMPSVVPLYAYSAGALAGVGVTTFGLCTAYKIRKDWTHYHEITPTDPLGNYPEKNKQYIDNQYIAIAGGLLTVTCGTLLIHKMMRRNAFSHRRRYLVQTPFELEKGWTPTVSNDGIGIKFKF